MFYAKETHAPLLDKQLFYQVQELLEKKEKAALHRNSAQTVSSYKPHSVFRVRLFLSPEGAKWRKACA